MRNLVFGFLLLQVALFVFPLPAPAQGTATAASESRAVWNPSPEQASAAALLGLPVEVVNSFDMRFRLIPSGSFLMGSERGTPDEIPVHRVDITRPFYLAIHELTGDQHRLVFGKKKEFPGVDLHPEKNVNWDQAAEFCRRLSEKEGKVYRLPTEAEWEYACRAGTTSLYFWGEVASETFAVLAMKEYRSHEDVGSRVSNRWGLYDMSGNVFEWCADWYDDRWYSISPASDPAGPASGDYRILRGGCSGSGPGKVTSAFRYMDLPASAQFEYGMRVLLEIPR